ncbi:MAG: thioredoxin domain-containing protein [Gaiellales bacterium]
MSESATDATFEELVLRAAGPVIVKFTAPWCRPCRHITPILEAIVADNSNVRLVELDVDDNLGVPSRYGVLSLPTTVLFRDGEPRATVLGAQPRRRFDEAFGPFLGVS